MVNFFYLMALPENKPLQGATVKEFFKIFPSNLKSDLNFNSQKKGTKKHLLRCYTQQSIG